MKGSEGEKGRKLGPFEAAISAIFSALVCVATIIFTVYVPQTRGFFNVGETMVYITALLFGPVIGGVSGGFGSMLADLLLGYTQFAPATLIIKGCEGVVVGFLNTRRPKSGSEKYWRPVTAILGVVVGLLLAGVGSIYYSGEVEIYLGTSESPAFIFNVPAELWYIIGTVVALSIVIVGIKIEPELGWTIFSIIIGGLIMVLGYFIYEYKILIGEAAYAEIPVNIGQMSVGLTIAIPVVRAVWRYMPSLKAKSFKGKV